MSTKRKKTSQKRPTKGEITKVVKFLERYGLSVYGANYTFAGNQIFESGGCRDFDPRAIHRLITLRDKGVEPVELEE